MHYRYVAFLEMFPDSQYRDEITRRIDGFLEFISSDSDRTFIPWDEFSRTYNYDGIDSVYYWRSGDAFMRVDPSGAQIWEGPICIGNIQFVAGKFYSKQDGIVLLDGTRFIYPSGQ